MGPTVITSKVLKFNEAGVLPTNAAVAANDGATITADKNDELMLVMLENSSATTTLTAQIWAGAGIQSVADLEITVAPSAKMGIVIESGRFKNSSGEIVVCDKNTANTVLKVGCVVLP